MDAGLAALLGGAAGGIIGGGAAIAVSVLDRCHARKAERARTTTEASIRFLAAANTIGIHARTLANLRLGGISPISFSGTVAAAQSTALNEDLARLIETHLWLYVATEGGLLAAAQAVMRAASTLVEVCSASAETTRTAVDEAADTFDNKIAAMRAEARQLAVQLPPPVLKA